MFDVKAFRAEFLMSLKREAIGKLRAKHGPRGADRRRAGDSRRDPDAYRDAWSDYTDQEGE